ncbi:MAG TPA: RNA polymerase sigma factor [Gemmatimonadaceae bacterium]|nr:RNA polymerase sigma factor [Gemmatimonadaceae bacterium]
MSEDVHARFQRLLHEHGPAIGRLAAAYETDPNEREDLVQDIVFALWRALPSFRGDCSEKTFLYRIAQNRGLTHRWRRKARDARLVALKTDHDVVDPKTETTGEHNAADAGRREDLLAAVQRLAGLHRDVMVLSLEGLTNTEIADILGITPGNVAVRLTRARVALRAIHRSLTKAKRI